MKKKEFRESLSNTGAKTTKIEFFNRFNKTVRMLPPKNSNKNYCKIPETIQSSEGKILESKSLTFQLDARCIAGNKRKSV